jgi:hypothetical protein
MAWRVGHACADANIGALTAHMTSAMSPNFFIQARIRKLPKKIKIVWCELFYSLLGFSLRLLRMGLLPIFGH